MWSHQSFSFTDSRHLVLAAHLFFVLLEKKKDAFIKLSREKKIFSVFIVYMGTQFSSHPGDNLVVWGGFFFKLHCIFTVV